MHVLFAVLLAALFLFPPAGHAQQSPGEQKIEWADTTTYFRRRFPEKKGQVRLTMGFPWINHFYVQPQQEPTGTYFGYGGFSVGGEYFYRYNRFLRAEAHVAFTISEFFFPLTSDVYTEYFVATAAFALSDNLQWNRWTFGWGLQWSNNTWQHRFCIPLDTCTVPNVYYNSNALGAIGTVHYQLGKSIFAGAVYRPNFVSLAPEPGALYQHSVSLDLCFRWGLRRRL